jgi:hypothetical protein
VKEVAEDVFVGTPDILIEKLRAVEDGGYKMMIVIPRSGKVQDIKETCTTLRDKVFKQL